VVACTHIILWYGLRNSTHVGLEHVDGRTIFKFICVVEEMSLFHCLGQVGASTLSLFPRPTSPFILFSLEKKPLGECLLNLQTS
jgi:hypothetical protein